MHKWGYNRILHKNNLSLWLHGNGLIITTRRKIWENIDDYLEQYWCEAVLYLMSILALEFVIVVGRAIRDPVHVKYIME